MIGILTVLRSGQLTVRRLLTFARPAELWVFAAESLLAGLGMTIVGVYALSFLPRFLSVTPEFSLAYALAAGYVLTVMVVGIMVILVTRQAFRSFQYTLARCELADDKFVWIRRCPARQEMVEDPELMRLSANVSRLCRAYRASHPGFARLLYEYRKPLAQYRGIGHSVRSDWIGALNLASEGRSPEGLEHYFYSLHRAYQEQSSDGRRSKRKRASPMTRGAEREESSS